MDGDPPPLKAVGGGTVACLGFAKKAPPPTTDTGGSVANVSRETLPPWPVPNANVGETKFIGQRSPVES